MASQNGKTDERKALEAKANEAGVEKRGRHFLSDEQLAQKIIEVKAVEEPTQESEVVAEVVEQKVEVEPVKQVSPSRKKAPSMNVSGIGRDDRTAMVNRFEREDPDSKYVFQNSNVTNRELAAKGLERTDYSVKNDVLCRTTKDSFEEYQQKKNQASYEAMQRIDGGTGIVGNHDSKAKTPKVIEP